MTLEFIELDIDWPAELSVFDLKKHILSKVMEYGEPLRWAITSVNTHSAKKSQVISVEAVLIINQDKEKGMNFELN